MMLSADNTLLNNVITCYQLMLYYDMLSVVGKIRSAENILSTENILAADIIIESNTVTCYKLIKSCL
jgi:hypothetical protein